MTDEGGFAARAAELREAQVAARTVSRGHDGGRAADQAWERFREAENRVYRPLDGVHRRVRAAEPEAIETATQFLEADPWCFRSGYAKARLLRALANVSLDPHYATRLRKVVIARIERPESGLRPTAVLAANVWNDDLRHEIKRRRASATPARSAEIERFLDAVTHKIQSAAGAADR